MQSGPMAVLVDQPAAPHLADLIDAIGELETAILDVHRACGSGR